LIAPPPSRVFSVLLAGLEDPIGLNCLRLSCAHGRGLTFVAAATTLALQDLINAVKGVPSDPTRPCRAVMTWCPIGACGCLARRTPSSSSAATGRSNVVVLRPGAAPLTASRAARTVIGGIWIALSG